MLYQKTKEIGTFQEKESARISLVVLKIDNYSDRSVLLVGRYFPKHIFP